MERQRKFHFHRHFMTMYWFVELGPTFSYIQRFSNDPLSQVMLTTLFYSFVYSFTQQIFTLIEEI